MKYVIYSSHPEPLFYLSTVYRSLFTQLNFIYMWTSKRQHDSIMTSVLVYACHRHKNTVPSFLKHIFTSPSTMSTKKNCCNVDPSNEFNHVLRSTICTGRSSSGLCRWLDWMLQLLATKGKMPPKRLIYSHSWNHIFGLASSYFIRIGISCCRSTRTSWIPFVHADTSPTRSNNDTAQCKQIFSCKCFDTVTSGCWTSLGLSPSNFVGMGIFRTSCRWIPFGHAASSTRSNNDTARKRI
jgi:hypothetical protein